MELGHAGAACTENCQFVETTQEMEGLRVDIPRDPGHKPDLL